MDEPKPTLPVPRADDESTDADLTVRLARLRSRMEAEGRTSAVRRIDAEIKRVGRKPKKAAGK